MNLKSIIPWKKEERQVDRTREDGNPFSLFQRQMDSLFDDVFGRSSMEPWNEFRGRRFAPDIDVNETDKEVRVTAELPGLDEKDVELSLTGNLLSIKGEKKEEHEEEKGDYYRSERSYGYFERAVQLPEGIDADKAKANFKKGVLKVSIPKKPEAQSSRRKTELRDD
jgi:HSP20 family protein